MENTLENKAKFFAQYWGQKVIKGNCKSHLHVNSSVNLQHEGWWISLTPLSQITDEDAIEVASLILKRRVNPLDIIRWDWRISIVTNREKYDQYEDCEIEMFISFDLCDNDIKFTWDYNHKKGTAVSERHCPNSICAYDFLRSRGYALPYMGGSVEKLIEYGWVKLKED